MKPDLTGAGWWLQSIYEVEIHDKRLALRHIYRAVEVHFARREIELLNEALGKVDLKQLSSFTMTGLIRVTSRAKAAMPNWKPLLRAIYAELELRDTPDLKGLFVGLRDELE